MRVLLGLAALSSIVAVQGQNLQLLAGTAASLVSTTSASCYVNVYANTNTPSNGALINNIPGYTNGVSTFLINPGTFQFSVVNGVSSILFQVATNAATAQIQYRWSGNPAGSSAYICDPCVSSSSGSTTACTNTVSGGVLSSTCPSTATCSLNPSSSAAISGQYCAGFTRSYYMTGLTTGAVNVNSFGIELYDTAFPVPNTFGVSFQFTRAAGAIVGDPQIVGMQGQDFQVHGVPDEIFNIVTYPTIQVNARFSYLESAECHDNYTACFAHPGTYISEEGFRLGKDKVRITAGSFKKGLTVSVNGKKIKSNVDLKTGAVELFNHRRVVIHTDIMKFTVTNSDKFLNQEIDLKDDKLVALGAERRKLRDNERFHSEVPLHGLQGQTWRNVEYASGLDYEGSIMDYHVVDGNLFGGDFVFNQFQA